MKDLSRSLQELPALTPPPGGWDAVSQRLDARQSRHRRRRRWAGDFALAASVLLAVVMLRPAPQAPSPTSAVDAAVAGLMQQSQALELRLSQLKTDASVWDGAQARSAAVLQRDVALIDVQLSDVAFNPQADHRAAETLWLRRVSLLNQLVSAHESPSLVRSTLDPTAIDEAEGEVLEL